MPERDVLHAVLRALGSMPGVIAWRNSVGVAMHAAGAPVRYGVGGRGAPDVLCEIETMGGWLAVWFEIKSAAGRLSAVQRAWHAAALRSGRHVYVVRSADDAVRIVREFQSGRIVDSRA